MGAAALPGTVTSSRIASGAKWTDSMSPRAEPCRGRLTTEDGRLDLAQQLAQLLSCAAMIGAITVRELCVEALDHFVGSAQRAVLGETVHPDGGSGSEEVHSRASDERLSSTGRGAAGARRRSRARTEIGGESRSNSGRAGDASGPDRSPGARCGRPRGIVEAIGRRAGCRAGSGTDGASAGRSSPGERGKDGGFPCKARTRRATLRGDQGARTDRSGDRRTARRRSGGARLRGRACNRRRRACCGHSTLRKELAVQRRPPERVGMLKLGQTPGTRSMNSLLSSTGSAPASLSNPKMKLA